MYSKEFLLINCILLRFLLHIETYVTPESHRHKRGKSNKKFLSENPITKPIEDEVRIGVLIPRFVEHLNSKLGYNTSIGAVSVAIDRIRRESLLSAKDITIVVNFDECNDATAVGYGIDMMRNRKIDVMIGPPCATTALAVAPLAKLFNIPMISWAATLVDLSDEKRFPTMSRVIGSALKMGRALKELLLHFNWKRVAAFYTDDNASRRCYSIVDSLRKTFLKAGIVNVLNIVVERISPTDEEIVSFLQTIKQFARIILVCLEHERDMRRFMLKAYEMEMTNDEYLFIMPDFVRDNNRNEMWLDMDSSANIDNMDQAAKKAFRSTMMVEMLTSSNDVLQYFKKEIIRKAKEEPFLIDSSNIEDQYGSLYSPFLHDAVYLYALALNKTLQQGGTIEDTRWIANNTRNIRFLGMSGEVVIDSQNTREPNFVVRIFDKGMKMTRVVELLMSNADGKTVNVLVTDKILFENRNGITPKDVPDCGFLSEKCIVVRQSITHWVAIGAFMCFLLVGFSTVGVFFFVKRRMLCNELGKMLWKINYKDIVFLNDKSRRSKSLGSLRTISTVASDETNEAMAKGDKNVAHYKGVLVTVKNHEVSVVLSNESDQKHLKCMKDLVHDNLNIFVGLCIDSPQPISLWKYASKGTLEDVLHADTVRLDWFFKYSLLRDVVSGMEYLHSSEILTHGQLKSSNCVVDGRWLCKISDYGLNKLRVESEDAKDKFWTAPEFLISTNTHSLPVSQPGDVYAFAILTQEVLLRDRPFCAENLIPEVIIKRVAKTESPPFRPTVKLDKENDVDPAMIQIMNDCWKEDPVLRPNFKHVKSLMKQMARGKNFNLMDHILKMMEKYASGLEQKISDRTKFLTEEAKKADLLLYRMLPKAVADRLKSGQMCDPETFNSVSILLSDVVGFSVISARSTPLQIVNLLNELYTVFDEVIFEYDAFKLSTVGDGFMCTSGLPVKNGNAHASNLADLALQLVSATKSFVIPHLANDKLEVRIGIHTGPCVAGVVGSTMPKYCIFGDTVIVANLMESNGKPSCVHISEETNRYLIELIGGYITKPRGEIMLKSKGPMFTYWLLGRKLGNQLESVSESVANKSMSMTNFVQQSTQEEILD